MTNESTSQDLLLLWKRSLDQGMEAWRKLVGQPQPPDVFQFWRPLFGQSMDVWTQMLQQGATGPDAMAQWKKFTEQSVEAWSAALGQAMQTEGFAAAMGKFLEQYLSLVGPLRKGLQASSEEVLRTLNLPSRKQVTDLASQVVSLDLRMEALEERLDGLEDGSASQVPLGQQMAALTSQVDSLGARLQAVEGRMEHLLQSLSVIEGLLKEAGEPKSAPAARRMKQPNPARGATHKEA